MSKGFFVLSPHESAQASPLSSLPHPGAYRGAAHTPTRASPAVCTCQVGNTPEPLSLGWTCRIPGSLKAWELYASVSILTIAHLTLLLPPHLPELPHCQHAAFCGQRAGPDSVQGGCVVSGPLNLIPLSGPSSPLGMALISTHSGVPPFLKPSVDPLCLQPLPTSQFLFKVLVLYYPLKK